MSPIGRIFIVLNLILAAVFLAWAANNVATSHDYKTKYDDEVKAHGTSKTELEGQISSLRANLDNKSVEADNHRAQAETAKAEAERQAGLVLNLNRQVSEAQQANAKNSSALTEIEATLGTINSSKDAAVAAQRSAESERDDALATAQDATTQAADLEAQNAALNNTIAELEGRIVALNREVSSLDTQLTTLVDVTGVTYPEIASQAQIDADVLQAHYDIKPGLVALNKGTKDGVKRGYTFEVYNGPNYKGQVRVENVRDDMCTALILRTEEGQTISSGDKASTRL